MHEYTTVNTYLCHYLQAIFLNVNTTHHDKNVTGSLQKLKCARGD